jgi:hypothetical protein
MSARMISNSFEGRRGFCTTGWTSRGLMGRPPCRIPTNLCPCFVPRGHLAGATVYIVGDISPLREGWPCVAYSRLGKTMMQLS